MQRVNQPGPYMADFLIKMNVIDSPVTNGETAKIGYNLPVRTLFGKRHNGEMAQKFLLVSISSNF